MGLTRYAPNAGIHELREALVERMETSGALDESGQNLPEAEGR
jgi:hypothetical protein